MSLQEAGLRPFEGAKFADADARLAPKWPLRVRIFKRIVDIHFALVGLPLTAVVAVALFVLNPFFNPGPVFFRQDRMGQGGEAFRIWKFRTMAPCNVSKRDHDDPLEEHRINRLGAFLRKSRLDELPNFINVLRGEMSLIGPRPDMVEHALAYSVTIPHYRERFRVKPGITGLAQIRYGYADHERAVRRKAANDLIYVERYTFRMDLHIIRRTIAVMMTGFGAR
jgi:lipopolysaccharide/colanic/teichoic acid biosynthesis glycosyltransferase